MELRRSARVLGTRGIILGMAIAVCVAVPAISQRRKTRPSKTIKQRPEKASSSRIPPEIQSALDHISADSMRGHLSVLASDTLEGRGTPSRGLDLAAEYIAAQFRRAGLKPAGDANETGTRSYFQTANWSVLEPDDQAFFLQFSDSKQTININSAKVTFHCDQAFRIEAAPLLRLGGSDKSKIESLKPEDLRGKVILTEFLRPYPNLKAPFAFDTIALALDKAIKFNAAFFIMVDRHSPNGDGIGSKTLLNPKSEIPPTISPAWPESYMVIHDPRFVTLYDSMAIGETRGTLTLNMPASERRPVKLRNVLGLLRGSDPVLRESYVIVSAHYDHLGNTPHMCEPVDGDSLCNGANDNGSGTVSVIELASALGTMKPRPKRSILFITWFGEEHGLLGSRYYAKHPVFPLHKTVAMVNLEQLGRTDSTKGPQLNNATMTGFDFTDLGSIFKDAGEKTGIEVYKDKYGSDLFFDRSDNLSLAEVGVPAHTLCTAFEFPDYHRPGDHWEKVDYENMARVNRMLALALTTIACKTEIPRWNKNNAMTEMYVHAWKKLHGKQAADRK